MENTKTSMVKRIADFFKSFVDSNLTSDGRVNVESLSRGERRELRKVLEESEENVEKIEASMKDKYKAKIDTDRAKKAASQNQQNKERENEVEEKTIDNN